jgi:hypothetical protein
MQKVETADAPVADLINYMNLMSNFPQDDYQDVICKKIKLLNLPQLNIELIRLEL